jgi:plastocyanin
MSNTERTRRRVLQGSASATLVGLAGCTSLAGTGGSGGTPTSTEGGGDHPGHAETEHGHDTVTEPKATREVLVNTARGENTTEYHFKPHVTWVTVGGTVTWTLESGTHTATAYHPDNDAPQLVPDGTEAWDSGTLSQEGATYEHTFDTEGVYHYLCKPHEQFGMLATVIVGEPHPDDQVALQMVPSDKPEEVQAKLEELNEMVRSVLGDGHHEGTETGDHHGDSTTESGDHHDEDDHHDDTTTESGHHEDDGDHHDETTTESDHHDDDDGHHEDTTTSA